LQTSVFGFPSLRLLLQKARHQRNEKQKWAPVVAATSMLCQKNIFHLSSGHWDLHQLIMVVVSQACLNMPNIWYYSENRLMNL
jgi:hypothetical protein